MNDQEARDERDALQRLIYTFETRDLGDNLAITTRDSYTLADAILAAGYRKQPEPEWEYARRYSEMDGSPRYRTISEADAKARMPDGHRSDGSDYWNYVTVRRQVYVPGPWEPVS